MQVQFFVLATNFAFKAAFGAGKAALPFACRTAQCGGQKCGVSLKQSCNSVCRDGEDQTSCVVGVKASVSGVGGYFSCCVLCAAMGLMCDMGICPCRAPGLMVYEAALVSQGTLGKKDC